MNYYTCTVGALHGGRGANIGRGGEDMIMFSCSYVSIKLKKKKMSYHSEFGFCGRMKKSNNGFC